MVEQQVVAVVVGTTGVVEAVWTPLHDAGIATIQVKADRIPVAARTASAEEKPGLWRIMCGIWPNYDAYQARTERDIPVVVLSPSRG
jgi:deazaflavin-dependent oxidoreductase (nitroreductase family)